jgi:molybdopterin/thiamine biosynthesis adenylyltransferase
MSEQTRDARHIALAELGSEGQASIAAGKVFVVGLGGLGCPAAEYLAASGVGTLVVNDFDHVDTTNLSRQILYGPGDVGRLKTEAAAERLNSLNPDVSVRCISERLDSDRLESEFRDVTLVLDGTDNFASRLAVNRAAVSAKVPLVFGAAIRLEGQLGVFENSGGGPCYRCLYDDEDEWLGTCQGNGVLAPVPGVIGTLMAVEALKLLAGVPSGLRHRMLLWDAKSSDWQGIGLAARPGCPDCQASD